MKKISETFNTLIQIIFKKEIFLTVDGWIRRTRLVTKTSLKILLNFRFVLLFDFSKVCSQSFLNKNYLNWQINWKHNFREENGKKSTLSKVIKVFLDFIESKEKRNISINPSVQITRIGS